MTSLRERLQELYDGDSDRAHRFRYGLLAFDLATLLFIVVSSFMPRQPAVEAVDVLIGLAVASDFLSRLAICPRPAREFLRPTTWADLAAIASFLAPIVGEGAGFLRILRTLRLLRTYQLLDRLRVDFPFFRRNEEVIIAVVNLAVFIFVMTSIVYATQHRSNPNIGNYVDALYFTVTSLTTTGYGDVTLQGTGGRLISVVVMICGVTLFLRLAQVLFRPYKVRFPCPTCGLQRHEPDAVHCKACGTLLNIPDEGSD
ncbi:potassium channel family protein [Methylobacterium isbiliense]|jgi:voltage-gated potassium channel|nr:potassium channel family protein [Methylobacterium isbiliense]MDN3623847.1 potassium channel family protein [Methylobacterium isbiliense]